MTGLVRLACALNDHHRCHGCDCPCHPGEPMTDRSRRLAQLRARVTDIEPHAVVDVVDVVTTYGRGDPPGDGQITILGVPASTAPVAFDVEGATTGVLGRRQACELSVALLRVLRVAGVDVEALAKEATR